MVKLLKEDTVGGLAGVKEICSIDKELLDRINKVISMPTYDRTRYMIGVVLTDGRENAVYEVDYLDADVATGNLIGMVEYGDKIIVQNIPRKYVLFKTSQER